MLFNSVEYLIFFPLVAIMYYALPFQWRWLLLLISSYFFYAWWKAEYVLILIISTLIDFFAGIALDRTENTLKRKLLLALSLTTNLGILFFFKYFNFFNANLSALSEMAGFSYEPAQTSVLLPVGISFYTFQTISYTINVYRRQVQAETHPGYFALYVTYFPQLVAGPIERAERLLPQLHQPHLLNAQRISRGLKLILWGMFKKVVIADNLAPYVNEIYNHPDRYEGLQFLMATVFFSFQIYYDFSGYSDIAVGSARVMGIELMQNFNHPYFANSVAAFWRRWHISLSTWFRDYVYIPLGGNRQHHYRNLMITSLLSGLWHGANWTFITWGGLHGLYLIIGNMTKTVQSRIKVNQIIHIAITYMLILFAWIFFRANSISDALLIIQKLPAISLQYDSINVLSDAFGLELMCTLLFIVQIIHYIERKEDIMLIIERKPLVLRWAFYSVLLWILFLHGNYSKQEFIYFTF
jgi:D-alanyl-lipoteichoic acid acyltransferase DltB (MBOAT superfamily)